MKEQFFIDPIIEANKHGIEVRPIPLKETKIGNIAKKLVPEEEVCGYIERQPNGKVFIYYNPQHHPNRQRFTIAHELAHYLLGHLDENNKQYRDTAKNFKTSVYDPKEVQANKLAAEILMPENILEYLIYKKGITSIKELAKIMQVSEVAMQYRLKNLGWIS